MKSLLVWIVTGLAFVTFIGLQRQLHRRHVPPTPPPVHLPTSQKVHRQLADLSIRGGRSLPGPESDAVIHQAAFAADQATKVDPKQPPAWYPKTREEEAARAKADRSGSIVVVGSLSGSEAKAKLDLRTKIDREVAHWLSGDVGPGWRPPTEAVDSIIRGTYVQPVIEDVGSISKDLDELVTLYRAGAQLDLSPQARTRLLGIHEKQVVRERMLKGGGVLAFVLIALASLSGYIRTDEATKGYYTNRLRLLTAAGVGGAGVLIYQMLA